MPARKSAASSKPKRETKKPATFVPGPASSIAKPSTRTTRAKPKAAPAKATRKAAPKKAPKRAPKRSAKPAPSVKSAAPAKTSTPKKAPKSAPKKSGVTKPTAAKKAAARRASRGEPKYAEMITEGIKSLRKKNGSSRQALEKYIEQHYPQRQGTKKWIRLTLSKLIHEGKIQKIRASYRMTPKNATSTSVKTKPQATKKGVRAAKAVKKPKTLKKKSTTAPAATTPSATSATPAESSGKPIWQFQHGGWKNYDAEASALVETQYQDWLNNNQMYDVRSVKSGTWEYNVDFRRMIQTNIQHPDHTERKIRRQIE